MKRILNLMTKKYSGNYMLCMYDDESGRIVLMSAENMVKDFYSISPVFTFKNLEELVEHLKEK